MEPPFKTIQDNGQDAANVIILNEQRYWFELYLDDGNEQVELPSKLIKDIEINESFFHFESYATITYHDPYQLFSKIYDSIADAINCEKLKQFQYNFKGNNNDLLHFKLAPLTGTEEELTPRVWHIQHTFTITGITPIGTGKEDSHVKLHCVDKIFNDVSTLKPDKWTCGRAGGNFYRNQEVEVKNLPTYPRGEFTNAQALKVGEAVYDLFEKAGFTDNLPKLDKGKSEEQKKLVLDEAEFGNGLLPYAKEESDVWDFGAEDHVIFTSPNTEWNYIHFIDYFTHMHGSSKPASKTEGGLSNEPSMDPCFLVLERPDEENKPRKLQLKSLIHYFQNSSEDEEPGPYHLENFFISTTEDSDVSKIFETIRSPLSKICDTDKGIKSKNSSIIENYKTVPIENNDSKDFLKTHIVHFHDGAGKLFGVLKSNVEDVRKYIVDNYLSKMITRQQGDERAVLMNLNKNKTENRDIKTIHINIPTQKAAIVAGRNRLLKSVMFLNRCLNWEVPGSTNRRSGRFVGVDKIDSSENSEFDNELFGQYFVTMCSHKINVSKQQYENELTGIKFYTFDKVNEVNEDI